MIQDHGYLHLPMDHIAIPMDHIIRIAIQALTAPPIVVVVVVTAADVVVGTNQQIYGRG